MTTPADPNTTTVIDSAGAATTAVTPQTPPEDPNWLNKRLERAGESRDKQRLTELGVSSFDELKTLVTAAKQAADANKSLTDRYTETSSSLTAANSQLASLTEVIKTRAEAEFSKLTEKQQNAVKAIAGDDYGKRLSAITALSETWDSPVTATSQTQATQTQTTQVKPIAAPATSTPTSASPSPTPPPVETGDAAVLATYENLQKGNPFAAAAFLVNNQVALSRARATK